VARAKALLAEAGYPNGFEMEILSMSDAPRKAMAQILQSALSKIGIKASIVAPEFSVLLGRANDQTFDIGVFGWSGTPDPNEYVFPLLHTSRRGSGGNNAWYSNPEVDKLIDAAAKSTDQAARKEMYAKVQNLFMSDLVHIPLYYKPSILGVGKRVMGITADPLMYIQLVTAQTNVWLKP
jgi:peptide/nickel transport system substrate-binding protein